MRRLEQLPAAIGRFHGIGGVVEFAVFDDAGGTEAEIADAIGIALQPHGTFDLNKLRVIGGRPISERAFFGDWWDPHSRSLVKRGNWQTEDGRTLTDPKFKALGGVKLMGGGSPIPDAGSGGQFAYAFAAPPYPLDAQPGEVQELFDTIRDFILPTWTASEIRDWSSPDLPGGSDYFGMGMEWWGVFLCSIYTPALSRLTIAFASTTD